MPRVLKRAPRPPIRTALPLLCVTLSVLRVHDLHSIVPPDAGCASPRVYVPSRPGRRLQRSQHARRHGQGPGPVRHGIIGADERGVVEEPRYAGALHQGGVRRTGEVARYYGD